MCLLPLYHCFGLLVVLGFAAYKRIVCINEMTDPLNIYKEFVKEKCGEYASVAVIYERMCKTPLFSLAHSKFVKHCIVGGGFTLEKDLEYLEKRYGKGKFMNGYGQTECSPLISLVYPDAPTIKKKTTVGKILKDLDVKIIDVDNKKDITNLKTPGEIILKGYVVCNGYYKLDKNKQPFDEDGYLHTGDMGYIDEDGYLVLTGRIKDIIIRNGENISPAEIEKAFEKYKEFSNVRVLGFQTLTDGEYVIAAVELKKKPRHFNESYYINDLHSILPSIKIPTHIIYMPSFPLNANGKLDERKLREICIDKLNKKVDHDLYLEILKIQKYMRHK
jgi:fatty-acyl-CoA synthase